MNTVGTSSPLGKGIALLLIATLFALPTSAFFAPKPAHALLGGVGGFIQDLITEAETLATAGFSQVSSIANVSTAQSTLLTQIKGYILDPLAHALAQAILKSITASVVNWINGKNGSGKPAFVQDLAGHLQSLGDTVSLSFISQFQQSINSPFAATIASSLQQNYLQTSSLAGFFAANQCTLSSVSPNINSFVSGDFSKGGWSAWFALTTKPQNDPYMLYQIGKGQLASVNNAAVTNRRQDLLQGSGFLSWCGQQDATAGFIAPASPDVEAPVLTQNADGSYNASCPAGTSDNGASGCIGTSTCPAGYTLSGGACTPNPSVANSGTCTNPDGTTGTIQTPGSVIGQQLSKVLGSGVDSLVNTHDFDQMVDAILAALINKVISDTGLLGTSNGSAASPSFTTQLSGSNPLSAQSTSGGGTVGASITTQLSASASSEITTINTYGAAWQNIGTAAKAAQTSLQSLVSCNQSHGGNDPLGAAAALGNVVTPMVTQAATATNIATNALTAAQKAQTEINNATTLDQTSQASNDIAAVLAAPPSQGDASSAQTQSRVTGSTVAVPTGSFAVTGGTTVDQMNLISQNAQTALATCQAGG